MYPTRPARISILSRSTDAELARIESAIGTVTTVDGRGGLEEALCSLLASGLDPHEPRTLDLIGHSLADHLVLGDWVLDTSERRVRSFCRGLADEHVLPRLGVRAVRLLGCETAGSLRARANICALSEILQVDVHGSTQMLFAAHYEAGGFRADCEHLLIRASDLRAPGSGAKLATAPHPRSFDVEMLPAVRVGRGERAWPQHVVDLTTARAIVELVERDSGAEMPGLAHEPLCEVLLPATGRADTYHRIQLVLEGGFVRAFPDGDDRPGIVYAISDPAQLRALLGITR